MQQMSYEARAENRTRYQIADGAATNYGAPRVVVTDWGDATTEPTDYVFRSRSSALKGVKALRASWAKIFIGRPQGLDAYSRDLSTVENVED